MPPSAASSRANVPAADAWREKLQGAIEIGLADAIGADEDGEPPGREPDRPQRAVVGGVDFADDHNAGK
jgi:hypothetical protein